jgi:hypothetical protein
MLVKILLRQARIANPTNPRTWLEDLQFDKWAVINAQHGQIVGTSTNGKSVSLQATPGITLEEITKATECAIACIEAGLTRPATEYRGLAR